MPDYDTCDRCDGSIVVESDTEGVCKLCELKEKRDEVRAWMDSEKENYE